MEWLKEFISLNCQRFVARSKIWQSTFLRLLPFILRTNFNQAVNLRFSVKMPKDLLLFREFVRKKRAVNVPTDNFDPQNLYLHLKSSILFWMFLAGFLHLCRLPRVSRFYFQKVSKKFQKVSKRYPNFSRKTK